MELKKEDYAEPCCPFDASQWKEEQPQTRIDIRRITEKLDEFFYAKDYAGARRMLFYWLQEARSQNDRTGEFQLENELMGLTRKLGLGEEAEQHAEKALALAEEPGIAGSTAAATAFVNAATVFKAFGKAERALPLFEKARAIYEARLSGTDARLGGLYNNEALALTDVKRYEEALQFYQKALAVMEQIPGGEADAAVTWLNMADLFQASRGLEAALSEIEDCSERAYACLMSEKLAHDGYYTFVCEKCIPVFEHYGYFGYAEELKQKAGIG